MRHILCVLECPLYNSINNNFLSYSKMKYEVVSRFIFVSFFKMDHHVDTSLCLIEAIALHYYMEWSSNSHRRHHLDTVLMYFLVS